MKTVIILTNSFPPINTISVYRYLSMARHLPEFGWNVIVVTPKWTLSNRTELERRIGSMPNDGKSMFERWDPEFYPNDGLRVERVPFQSRSDLGESEILKIWLKCRARYFDYLLGDLQRAMLRKAQVICGQEKVDAVLSGGSPEYLFRIAGQLCVENQIPWVADYRDLKDQNRIQTKNRFKYCIQWLSRRVLIGRNNQLVKFASVRTTVSEGLAERLRARNTIPVRVVMNGFDPNDSSVCDQKGNHHNDKFTITYGGTIYPNQHPHLFFEGLILFLKKAQEANNRLLVQFFGQSSDYLSNSLPQELTANVVSLAGTISRPKMLKHFSSSDVLLLLSIQSKGIATGKLFEYLASKRPILSVPGDDDITDKILYETGAGKVAKTAEDISQVLGDWFQEWKEKGRISIKSDDYEISQYSRKSQTEKVAGVLNSVTY